MRENCPHKDNYEKNCKETCTMEEVIELIHALPDKDKKLLTKAQPRLLDERKLSDM